MNIGARILKTGIAVALAIYISQLLKLESPIFSAIAAFLAVQPSVYRSWKTLLEQMKANVIGVVCAVLGLVMFGNGPIVIGLVVILTIMLTIKFKLNSSISIASLTVIAIMEVQNAEFLFYAGNRMFGILIGVFAAVILNIIFMPPKYEDKLLQHIETTSEKLSMLLRSMLRGELEKGSYKKIKESIEDNIKKADELYDLYKDEFNYFLKKGTLRESKKIVIFREMIKLIKKESAIINSLKKREFKIKNSSEEITNGIQEILFDITFYDEKIFMKFEEQIKTTDEEELNQKINLKIQEILERIVEKRNGTEEEKREFQCLLSVVSNLNELVEILNKLNKLIVNYRTYNDSEKKNFFSRFKKTAK